MNSNRLGDAGKLMCGKTVSQYGAPERDKFPLPSGSFVAGR
jgi:hypothetical protein